jgi:putative ABC transport system permease protein
VVDNETMTRLNRSWPTSVEKSPSTFTPFQVTLHDPAQRATVRLTIVGVLAGKPGYIGRYAPIFTSRATFAAAHDTIPAAQELYFRAAPDARAHAVALWLGSAFLHSGLDVTEAQTDYNQNHSLQIGFNNLLEGFMALGLIVGIAALGVIATRSVVERRQQIGMVRAIGFKRGMVQATFLLESSIITVLGTVIGSGLGILLGRQVIDYFAKTNPGLTVSVPWTEVGLIVVAVYLASLLTTYLPAWQASHVQPAEALRYE